ncbi:AAA family ATPase [Thalassotalea mangrovi]|uniref:AAA domain-containing protein n=1 Tax=Thalassotalea mangrovi TaxID=2572245 RepID=A0A4U1B385_9GAMM|nr:AAA family ATPase [Thalassotalea mangrovi]TKB44231.1 hypothetical protein E8M12_12515 [Thalassotalea mangrovi]
MNTRLIELNEVSTLPLADGLDLPQGKQISLPFLVHCLVVCTNPVIGAAIKKTLDQAHNLMVAIEPRLPEELSDYQFILLVDSGDQHLTLSVLEQAHMAEKHVLLVGDNIAADLMRRAIQLQIRDFIPLDNFEQEIFPAVERIVVQIAQQVKLAPIVSIINGKGGSGASFLSHAIGQIYSEQYKEGIALYDGDFQHGSLANMLGVEPEYYLDNALMEVGSLDGIAIKSMMSKANNLCLLPVKPYSHLTELSCIDEKDIALLINKMRYHFELVIADLSRGLEANHLNMVLSSDIIYVVVQQNIASIRESKALVKQLINWQQIDKGKIHLIVNRYSEKHISISIDDIKQAIGIDSVFVVQNNFELASAATDLGKPLSKIEGSAGIRQQLNYIVTKTSPIAMDININRPGFWARLIGKDTRK